jgi:hypothetical protein
MAELVANGEQTFVDANGDPLVSGRVFFYLPNTGTLDTTWQDAGLSVANTNPVVLDAAGRAVIWGNKEYRQVVQDQFGNVQWDRVAGTTPGVISGNLVVSGDVNTTTLHVTGGAAITGGLTVDNLNATNNVTAVSGNITHLAAGDITASSINDTGALNAGGATLGGTTINGDLQVNGNETISAGHQLQVDTIVTNSASFINFPQGVIAWSPGGGEVYALSTHGDIEINGNDLHIAGGSNPRVSFSNTADPDNFAIWAGSGGFRLGTSDGAGNPATTYLLMDTTPVVVCYPNFVGGSGAQLGLTASRWALIWGDEIHAHTYVTDSTDAASPPLTEECLPYILSIQVKTEPQVGLAADDLADVPGAVTSSGGVDYNAISACLWKGMQELAGREQAAAMEVASDSPTTTSTTFVTSGDGVQFTPSGSSRGVVMVNGQLGNTGTPNTSNAQIVWGTGTYPGRGVSITSATVVGGVASMMTSRAGESTSFALTALLTGLQIGQEYWVDVAFSAATGTATLSQVTITALEVLDPAG